MFIHQAPFDRFIDDVRENTISDIMTENHKARMGWELNPSAISAPVTASYVNY